MPSPNDQTVAIEEQAVAISNGWWEPEEEEEEEEHPEEGEEWMSLVPLILMTVPHRPTID